MSFEDVGMYPELDPIFTFDDEIGVGVVVLRMEGAFWQSHRKLSKVFRVRVEKENSMTRVVLTFWSSRKRVVDGVSHTAPCSSPKAGAGVLPGPSGPEASLFVRVRSSLASASVMTERMSLTGRTEVVLSTSTYRIYLVSAQHRWMFGPD